MRRVVATLTLMMITVIGAAALVAQNRQPAPQIPPPLDVIAPPKDAERSPTGLASRVIEKGTGTKHPGPSSFVTVNYTGWTTDGVMFESTLTGGKPASFGLDGVIRGWNEGVQLMVVGEKRRFWIPSRLAYDNAPGMPGGTLVFDIELIAFK